MQFNIGDFLKKFKNLVPHEKKVKDALVQVVQKETGILLSRESISFNNNIIFVNTVPTVKNELFMRKQCILSEMKKVMGENSPRDMR